MRFLRKNTAVIVTVGPFYDKTDGVTIETGLTITNERITLTADTDDGSAPTLILDNVTGATAATANDLNYITNSDAGVMQLELAAADVNRLGRMFLTITDAANHVPVFHEFMVVNAALYDAFFATTGGAIPNAAADAAGGLPISDAGGLDLDAQIGTDIDAILVDTGTTLDGRIPAALVSGRIDASVGAMAADVVTAAAIAAGAVDADALAADAVDEIWDELIGDSTVTARQAMKAFMASLAGKLSGAATTTVTIRNVADDTDRITATVDADGNRTAVTLSL